MVLPAGIARFWARDISVMMVIAVLSAILAGYAGLVLSFFTKVPPGPAIILVAALVYLGLAAVRPGERAVAAAVSRAAIWRPETMMRRAFDPNVWCCSQPSQPHPALRRRKSSRRS